MSNSRGALGAAAFTLGAWGVVAALFWPLPPDALSTAGIDSVVWLDREGRRIAEQVGPLGVRAESVAVADVSPHFIAALLAAEDKRFYSHHGIDAWAVGRAVWQNLRAGRVVSGGSTLTQQLARLLLSERAVLTGQELPSRSLPQKLLEARLALRLELSFDKPALLQAFINRAPFGSNAVGVQAAAARIFAVRPAELSLAQAAYLAALPKGPSALSKSPSDARLRQWHILRLMLAHGAITAGQLERAKAEPLRLGQTPEVRRSEGRYAVAFARTLLLEGDQKPRGTIRLTIDEALEHDISDILDEQIPHVYARGGRSAAAVVIDNESGEVLAMLGAAFEDNPRWGQFNAAVARRQPGSALKPFLYAAALASGSTAATLAADVYRPYPDTWGVYLPENYDQRYHGPVRFRESLAQSLNVAAVDVLWKTGLEHTFNLLDAVGLKTLDRRPSFFGLGLALGSGGVRLLDLASAYATLARGGVFRPWRLFAESTPGTDDAVRRGEAMAADAERRVIDARVAYIISNIIADAGARTPQFGPHSVLSTPYWTAVKTGTSKGFHDNWTVGFTTAVTVGVWVGDPTGRPMRHMSGVEGAGVIWRKIMNRVTGYRSAPPVEPGGIVHARICPVSGKLVGPSCPGGLDEIFVAGTAPGATCDMHRRARVDLHSRRGEPLLVPPGCDLPDTEERLVTVYPPAFAAWVAEHEAGIVERYTPRCPAPAAGATLGQASIRLTSPAPSETLRIDGDAPLDRQALLLAAEVEGWTGPVTFVIDDETFRTLEAPYEVFWPLRRGDHRFSARLGTNGTQSAEHRVVVR